jgi:hypothetical protein
MEREKPKFISEGEKGAYIVMNINYKAGEIENGTYSIPYTSLMPIGFEKSKGFSSGTFSNSENKGLEELELKNKALKRLEEGLIDEANKMHADFILIEANTNNGSGQHWRFDTHYRFFVKR